MVWTNINLAVGSWSSGQPVGELLNSMSTNPCFQTDGSPSLVGLLASVYSVLRESHIKTYSYHILATLAHLPSSYIWPPCLIKLAGFRRRGRPGCGGRRRPSSRGRWRWWRAEAAERRPRSAGSEVVGWWYSIAVYGYCDSFPDLDLWSQISPQGVLNDSLKW